MEPQSDQPSTDETRLPADPPQPTLEPFDDSGLQRVLCVVAHPDDMEYGGSAAVAEWTARGVEVSYLLLTAGEAGIRDRPPREVGPLRADEQRRACGIVGVRDLTILDLPDGLVEPTVDARRHIARHIRRVRPDAVVGQSWELEVPWGLNHVDHRATGIATVDAMRDADNPWLYRDLLEDEGLEPWATPWLLVPGPGATHGVPLSEASVEKGVQSLAAHEVYLGALPDHLAPRDLVGGITGDGGSRLDTAGRSDADTGYALPVRAVRMA